MITYLVSAIILSVIALSISMLISSMICRVTDINNLELLKNINNWTSVIVGFVTAIFVIRQIHKDSKVTVYLDDLLNMNAVYKRKHFTFNIIKEYKVGNLQIVHYTHSETTGLKFKNLNG